MRQIAILSEEKDLHGLLVQRALGCDPEIVCHFVSVDRISDSPAVTWSNWGGDAFSPTILTADGINLRPRDLDLLWWRRLNPPQIIPPDIERAEYIRLITNDCHAAVLGLFANEFSGKWINDISATRAAENKLIQLRAAARAGFTVPRTLVSNDPAAIRAFCEALDHRVVVKAVRGTAGCHLFTRLLAEEHLASDGCLRLSPAIYQEMIPGRRHVRAHCFGEAVHAVEIDSDDLDWRENLDARFTVARLEPAVDRMLLRCLRLLGLRMGIVDLKMTAAGLPVWLEVNSQGQFLFAEGLSGLDLTSEVAAFLAEEAKMGQART